MNEVHSMLVPGATDSWKVMYSAAFVTNLGCNCSETEEIVLMPEPRRRDELEASWAELRKVAPAARQAWRESNPQPETLKNGAKWRHATWGEERSWREGLEADLSEWRAGLAAFEKDAVEAWWSSSSKLFRVESLVRGEYGSPVEVCGLDYQDEPVSGPMAVLYDQGCRCGWGGTYYASFAKEDDLASPCAVLRDEGRTWLAFCGVGGVWPDFVLSREKFLKALEAAEETKTAVLVNYEEIRAEKVWARELSSDEVDALDEESYARYAKLRSKIARFMEEDEPSGATLYERAVAKAESKARRQLLEGGLIEIAMRDSGGGL